MRKIITASVTCLALGVSAIAAPAPPPIPPSTTITTPILNQPTVYYTLTGGPSGDFVILNGTSNANLGLKTVGTGQVRIESNLSNRLFALDINVLSGEPRIQSDGGNTLEIRGLSVSPCSESSITMRDASSLHSNNGKEVLAFGYENSGSCGVYSHKGFLYPENDPENPGTNPPIEFDIGQAGDIAAAGDTGLVSRVRQAFMPDGRIVFYSADNLVVGVGTPLLTIPTLAASPIVFGTYTQQVGAYSAAGTALPTCTSGLRGARAVVTDATAPTYLGSYTSGGSVTAPVFCNGTAWVTD